jgi:hypothetical protein
MLKQSIFENEPDQSMFELSMLKRNIFNRNMSEASYV